MKQLSIVTICYNEPNLERTCKSIVNQTWQDFEWVVVDGGSNEDTQKIWNKYKYRIDKFISEADSGRYNAMNKGINISSGEYLLFLNAGDELYYNNVLHDIFDNNIKYTSDILYGDEIFSYEDARNNCIELMPSKITKDFLYFSCVRHQSTFIKKDLFEKYGLYNEDFSVVSDFEKWIVFFNNGVIYERIPYIISLFNMNGISTKRDTHKIALAERRKVILKHFSQQEIEKAEDISKKQCSFIEKIFSIKNTHNNVYKVITILGIHIKIKRRIKG